MVTNLGQCSAGSWGPRLSGHDSRSLHHTPTNSGWGSVHWHSGIHWVHMSDILCVTNGTRAYRAVWSYCWEKARIRYRLIRNKTPWLHSPHSWDSSEPSLQSLSWSHTKCLGIHCRFWHMNSSPLHVLLNTEKDIFGEWILQNDHKKCRQVWYFSLSGLF